MMGRLHLSPEELILALLLALIIINPLSTLAHHLAQAIGALVSTPDKVVVIVGSQAARLRIVFGRLTVWWSPIPAQSIGAIGLCMCELRSASPRGQLLLILAGPAVTVLLIPIYTYAAFLTARSIPGVIPATFGVAAFSCFVSSLWDLDPRETKDEKAGLTLRRDGPQALDAYRMMRRGSSDIARS